MEDISQEYVEQFLSALPQPLRTPTGIRCKENPHVGKGSRTKTGSLSEEAKTLNLAEEQHLKYLKKKVHKMERKIVAVSWFLVWN